MVKFEVPNFIIPQERGQEIEVVDTFFLDFDESDDVHWNLKNKTYISFRELALFIESYLEKEEGLPSYDDIVVLSMSKDKGSESFEVTFDLIKYKD